MIIFAGVLFALAIGSVIASFTGGPTISAEDIARWQATLSRPFTSRTLRVRQDLYLAGSDPEGFAVKRLAGLTGGLAGGVILGQILSLSPVKYALCIIAVGMFGWMLPRLATRDSARKAREEANNVVRQWVGLVAQQVMAGSEPEIAMLQSAQVGTRPGWRLLYRHLLAAQHNQRALWEGLDSMARRYGIDILNPIVGALALAAERGTGLAESILAISDSAWETAVSAERENAAKRDQIAVVPATGVALALGGILIYPPFVSLTSGGI